MKVVGNMGNDLSDGIPHRLNLERFSEDDGENVLFYGLRSTVDEELKGQHKNYKRKVLLNLWSPCEWMSDNLNGKDSFQQIEYFDEVYSICPYTIEWLRKKTTRPIHKYIFHPHDDSVILDKNEEKIYDVCYFGGFPSNEHLTIASTVKSYEKHVLMSKQYYEFLTHHNVSHEERLKIVNQSKISIIFNMLCLNDKNVENIKKYNGWEDNPAFSVLEHKRVPQYKARMNESGMCNAFMLVILDKWNVCLDFWKPGQDFLFTTWQRLQQDIDYILNNYDDLIVKNIRENAYCKSFLYNAKSAYELIKSGEEWRV